MLKREKEKPNKLNKSASTPIIKHHDYKKSFESFKQAEEAGK